MNEFDEKVEFLKHSPIFAMSLGSKELFHSNFWGWIIEQKFGRPFINVFFPEFDISQFKEVKREDNNRDLVIRDNLEREFVIENKIKSYPSKEQLEKYECYQGVITGINEPPFVCPEKWTFVSYKDIADKLKEIVIDITDLFNKSLIEQYIQMLLSINDLLDESLKETEGRLSFWTENIWKLHEIRMLDVYRKVKADDFVQHCKGIIEEIKPLLCEEDGWGCWISRSFNNGKSTISFEIQKKVKDDYKGQIGIQIEDNQFRFFLGVSEKRNITVNDIFKYGLDIGWFDGSYNKKENKTIRGKYTSMKKNPCSYSNRWVYQYFDTWSKKQDLQKYEFLIENVKEYLKQAVDIINQGKLNNLFA